MGHTGLAWKTPVGPCYLDWELWQHEFQQDNSEFGGGVFGECVFGECVCVCVFRAGSIREAWTAQEPVGFPVWKSQQLALSN